MQDKRRQRQNANSTPNHMQKKGKTCNQGPVCEADRDVLKARCWESSASPCHMGICSRHPPSSLAGCVSSLQGRRGTKLLLASRVRPTQSQGMRAGPALGFRAPTGNKEPNPQASKTKTEGQKETSPKYGQAQNLPNWVVSEDASPCGPDGALNFTE